MKSASSASDSITSAAGATIRSANGANLRRMHHFPAQPRPVNQPPQVLPILRVAHRQFRLLRRINAPQSQRPPRIRTLQNRSHPEQRIHPPRRVRQPPHLIRIPNRRHRQLHVIELIRPRRRVADAHFRHHRRIVNHVGSRERLHARTEMVDQILAHARQHVHRLDPERRKLLRRPDPPTAAGSPASPALPPPAPRAPPALLRHPPAPRPAPRRPPRSGDPPKSPRAPSNSADRGCPADTRCSSTPGSRPPGCAAMRPRPSHPADCDPAPPRTLARCTRRRTPAAAAATRPSPDAQSAPAPTIHGNPPPSGSVSSRR